MGDPFHLRYTAPPPPAEAPARAVAATITTRL
jgi:hypothetical protein